MKYIIIIIIILCYFTMYLNLDINSPPSDAVMIVHGLDDGGVSKTRDAWNVSRIDHIHESGNLQVPRCLVR